MLSLNRILRWPFEISFQGELSNGFLAIVKRGKEKSEVSLRETLAKTKDSTCFNVNVEAISYRLKKANELRLSAI